jgi:hypothetical protein
MADFVVINDVTINYSASPATNTRTENAMHIAAAINGATGVNVIATANSNGTLTLQQDLPGENNVIRIDDTPDLSELGLDTLGTYEPWYSPPPPGYYVVSNGTNAAIKNIFIRYDGNEGYTRSFEHNPPAGEPSTLDDLANLVLGKNPALPLIPGVVLTADELQPGQATVITHNEPED